ncbi:MAG: FAD-dependent oxidoreductase [Pseudomonadota bacterium]
MQRIAVIGGGIAGLTVALRRLNAGDQVVLFEAAPKVGGQLSSETRDGFLIEHGAEGFVARSEAVPALAMAAGISDHLVDQLEHRSFRFDGAQLQLLEPGEAGRLLGFQVPADELGRGIRSFLHGMGELPERLAGILRGRLDLQLNCSVSSLTPHDRGVTVRRENGPSAEFSSAVIATSARAAAALLEGALGPPACALRDSTLLSSVTVALAYRREHVQNPLAGSGFIVPDPEQLEGARAVTFTSSKLPHRAPPDHALFRIFFRPSEADLRDMSDLAWAERAGCALARALPLSGAPVQAVVSRWSNALPVFDDAHRARVAALTSALAGRRIWLAGAAFHGSGIDAAIRSAERAALDMTQ